MFNDSLPRIKPLPVATVQALLRRRYFPLYFGSNLVLGVLDLVGVGRMLSALGARMSQQLPMVAVVVGEGCRMFGVYVDHSPSLVAPCVWVVFGQCTATQRWGDRDKFLLTPAGLIFQWIFCPLGEYNVWQK